MLEDVLKFAFDEYGVGDGAARAKGEGIVNEVVHHHATFNRLEGMEVMPELIRAEALLIDKRSTFFDMFDLGDPGHLDQRGDTNAIRDDLSFIHPFTSNIQDFKAKVIRCNRIEVARCGKKIPRLIDGNGKELPLLKCVNGHVDGIQPNIPQDFWNARYKWVAVTRHRGSKFVFNHIKSYNFPGK